MNCDCANHNMTYVHIPSCRYSREAKLEARVHSLLSVCEVAKEALEEIVTANFVERDHRPYQVLTRQDVLMAHAALAALREVKP